MSNNLGEPHDLERSLGDLAGSIDDDSGVVSCGLDTDIEQPLLGRPQPGNTSSPAHATTARIVKKFPSEELTKFGLLLMGLLPWQASRAAIVSRYVFCFLVLVALAWNMIEEVYYAFICYNYQTPFNQVFCVYETKNSSTTKSTPTPTHKRKFDPQRRKIGGYFGLTMAVTNAVSYILLQTIIFKLQKNKHFMKTGAGLFSRVSVLEWNRLSRHCLFWFTIISSAFLWAFLHQKSDFEHALVNLFTELGMLSGLMSCLLFAMFLSPLKAKAKDTQKMIVQMKGGHVDNVIELHGDLCTDVFATSLLFKRWFVFHWLGYGLTAALYFIFFFHDIFQKPFYLITPFEFCMHLMFLTYIFYVFLFPCLEAALVTITCLDIISDINIKKTSDWPANHPLRSRSSLLLFTEYAQIAQCGYRVGRYLVNLSFVYISLFSSLIGILWKILEERT